MKRLHFRDVPIKLKLMLSISVLALAISVFMVFFFPARQNAVQKQEFLARMGTVADMVSFGAGVGLGTDQLLVIKNVFDWSKEDSSLSYLVVLDTDGTKIAQHPQDTELDYETLSSKGAVVVEGDVARFVRDINYEDESYGALLLGASMQEVSQKVAATRRTTIFASLGVLLFGVLMAYFLGDYFKKHLQRSVDLAESIKSGNLAAHLDTVSRDEVGQLNTALNEMSATLRANQEEIQSTVDMANRVVTGVNGTIEKLKAGQLNARVNIGSATGDFRQLVEGFNASLDTVVAPISEATSVLEQLANRNLVARMTGNYQGEHALIKESLNQAAQNLDESLQQVSSSSEQVASAATQISTGSQSVAQASSEQASSLQEIASSLQEMTSMTNQNAANAKEARGLSDAAKTAVEGGVGSMEQLSNAIDRIKTSSDETSRIVKTIDEIAFQTNLLALNAAVEAARAGEAGKGFAVVAEEVRSLAMRSAEAAKDTARLIEDAVKNSEDGVNLNQEVTQQLADINTHVNKVSEMMGEIAAASEQQSEGIDQVNTAVEQMNQVTQQTAANSEESASTAAELSGQAEEMRSLVGRFQLSQAGLSSPNPTRPVDNVSPDVPVLLSSESRSVEKHTDGSNGKKQQDVTPEQLIPLGDVEDGAEFSHEALKQF